ncbi:MAG: hypothetical protein WC755_09135, partial [Candidatus Woesearchaeota archaeon]
MKFSEAIRLDEENRILINDNKNYAKVGRFFNFSYSSKYYEDLHKLEFYDKNPLIITLDHDSKYILALNLHYFPTTNCTKMIEKMEKDFTKYWPKNESIAISWEYFKDDFQDVKPKFLIKRYI